MNSLFRSLKSRPLFCRAIVFGALAALLYGFITIIALDQQAHDFQYWLPFPLWVFSLPGMLLAPSAFKNAPAYLFFGLNAVLWFIVGAILSLLSKRAWRVMLLLVGLFIVAGVGLYLWAAMEFRSMGDPPMPTPDAAYQMQLTAMANTRATTVAKSSIKPIGQPISVETGMAGTLAFSPQGNLLAVAREQVELWSVDTHQRLGVLETGGQTMNIWGLAFSSDGKRLAVSTTQKPDVRRETHVWDMETQQLLLPALTGYRGVSMAFSPNGKLIATGDNSAIALWDVDSRALIGRLDDAQGQYVNALAFSPDGKLLAAGTAMTVSVWDVATRKLYVPPFAEPNRAVYDVKFSPDGKYIFARDSISGIHGWQISTGQETTLPVPRYSGADIIFSPNEKFIALTGYNNTVLLFIRATGQLVEVPMDANFSVDDFITSLAFSSDSNLLAVGSSNKSVTILDLSTYK